MEIQRFPSKLKVFTKLKKKILLELVFLVMKRKKVKVKIFNLCLKVSMLDSKIIKEKEITIHDL